MILYDLNIAMIVYTYSNTITRGMTTLSKDVREFGIPRIYKSAILRERPLLLRRLLAPGFSTEMEMENATERISSDRNWGNHVTSWVRDSCSEIVSSD